MLMSVEPDISRGSHYLALSLSFRIAKLMRNDSVECKYKYTHTHTPMLDIRHEACDSENEQFIVFSQLIQLISAYIQDRGSSIRQMQAHENVANRLSKFCIRFECTLENSFGQQQYSLIHSICQHCNGTRSVLFLSFPMASVILFVQIGIHSICETYIYYLGIQ